MRAAPAASTAAAGGRRCVLRDRWCLGPTRTWGTACFVGERGQVTLEVSPDLLRRQITLVGSWTFSLQGLADCAEFVAEHGIPVDKLFTHRWRLEEAAQAYALFDGQRVGKGVFLPS